MKSLFRAALLAASVACFGSASAADLRPHSYAPQTYAAPNWTGFHVGASAGWNQSSFLTVPDYGMAMPSGSGFAWALQGGYLQQFGKVVVGIEADYIVPSGKSRQMVDNCPGCGFFASTTEATAQVSWVGTARGTLGYEVLPGLLPYVTAGAAYGQLKRENNTVSSFFGTSYSYKSTMTSGATGYVLGLGAKYALTENLSLDVSYKHIALDAGSFRSDYYSSSSSATNNMITAGLNYKF